MRILEAIQKGIKTTVNELIKPERFKIGDDFEEFTRDYAFPKEYYEISEMTHKYNQKEFIKSNLNPDFKLNIKGTKDEFWLECKYKKIQNGMIELCDNEQLIRYKEKATKTPTIMFLGTGGTPKRPEILFLIPIREIRYNSMYLKALEKYLIKEIPITKTKVYSTCP